MSTSAPAPSPAAAAPTGAAGLADDDVVLVSAVRTPMGKRRGALSFLSSVDLGAIAVRGALERVPEAADSVGQVIVGNVLQAGAGQNVGRQVSIAAGLPFSVPAMTVNEVCGSGLKAAVLGAQLIRLGQAEVVVAAGTESMTRAPLVSAYDPETREYGEPRMSLVSDGLEDAFSSAPMGLTAEEVATRWGVDREPQDAWALASQQRAAAATAAGAFAEEILPIELPDGTVMDADEPIRAGLTAEGLAALDPVFHEEGTVTAGTSSPVTDGAAAIVLASGRWAREHGAPVLARLAQTAEVAVDPAVMGIGPRYAIPDLLGRAGLEVSGIDTWEINEAFGVVAVLAARELGIDPERVNPDGGAIALGHPLGATGVRLLVTLAHRMRRDSLSRGVASLCVGGGMGLAALLEAVPEAPSGAADQDAPAQAPAGLRAGVGGSLPLPGTGRDTRPFYRLSPAERRETLVAAGSLSQESAEVLADEHGLDPVAADRLIENQIGQTHLPLGVLPGIVVDGRSWDAPMTTEEASVVAAASNGARIVRAGGGFTTSVPGRLMIGQVVIADPVDPALAERIGALRPGLLETAAQAYPSIVERGGGLRDIRVRTVAGPGGEGHAATFVCLDLLIDVRDAQGANIIDTIGEAIAGRLRERFPEEEVLMAIVSNYATESLVEASCEIPVAALVSRRAAAEAGADDLPGPEREALLGELGAGIARRIALASDLAQVDPHRAVTHNKGIMNGVHAVTLAVGNDTRAIEAGCHAWASRDGQYRGLATWSTGTGDDGAPVLRGSLSLPLPLATVGGASRALPEARAALDLLGAPDAESLARVTACIGLAQNLTAVRALVTDGIQKGHMSLHARALAIAVGAQGDEIEAVAARLREAERMNQATARELLAAVRAAA